MKAIIQCCTPQECERIARGEQAVKVCKTAPNEAPFKVYIYQIKESKRRFLDHRFNSFFAGTSHYKDMGKVIGEYICNKAEYFDSREAEWAYAVAPSDIWCTMPMSETEAIQICKEKAFLTDEDIIDRFGEEDWKATFLYISELKIYDDPRELSEFVKPCNWNYDCCTCKRAVYELTKAEARLFYGCDRELTRPPQSWCYVEEN